MTINDFEDDGLIRGVLGEARTIAVVGASPNPMRPSTGVLGYLVRAGYTVFPVNPGHAGREIGGQRVYARLADIPEPIDIVDVFRRSEAIPALVDEILALDPLPKALWLQLDIVHPEAAARARAAGIKVVMDRCSAVEHSRLFHHLRKPAVAVAGA